MAELRRHSYRTTASYAGLCVLVVFLLGIAYFFGIPVSAEENGLLENTQAVLIVLSCLLPLFYLKNAISRAQKILLLSTALLPFSFFFREVEVKNMDLHQSLIFIGSGLPNQLLVVGLWVVVLLVMVWFREGYLRLWFDYLWREVTGYLLLACLVLLLCAGVVENLGPDQQSTLFIEEAMELLAYSLLLLAAGISGSASSRAWQAQCQEYRDSS